MAISAKINKNIVVAQRLKRLPTIIGKLKRFDKMRLSSMQDIAGVRVIVKDMEELAAVEKEIGKLPNLYKISDYIKNPKNSGYRGKHFIFRENNMFVEVQLRTQLQHLWATSVETTDVFCGSSMKTLDEKTYWHDFFIQVSTVFAIAENEKTLPDYKGKELSEVCSSLEENVSKHKIFRDISTFALTQPFILNDKVKNAYYAVMFLDFKKKEAVVTTYREEEYDAAFSKYEALEKKAKTGSNTVLVAVSQIKELRNAYPNYFMDLNAFLSIIKFILDKAIK